MGEIDRKSQYFLESQLQILRLWELFFWNWRDSTKWNDWMQLKRISEFHPGIRTAEHAQSRRALFYCVLSQYFLCYAAGGTSSAFYVDGEAADRNARSPNSHGRLSLNLTSGPATKHPQRTPERENQAVVLPPEKEEKKKERKKERKAGMMRCYRQTR